MTTEDDARASRVRGTMGQRTMLYDSGLSWCLTKGPHIKCLVNPKPRQVALSQDSKGSSVCHLRVTANIHDDLMAYTIPQECDLLSWGC